MTHRSFIEWQVVDKEDKEIVDKEVVDKEIVDKEVVE